jgi:MFS transporter, ACS family, D-galactonate transporter
MPPTTRRSIPATRHRAKPKTNFANDTPGRWTLGRVPTPAPTRIPRRRWGIGVLLGSGVVVSFFDRINLSVAAPQLVKEFNMNPEDLGYLLSSFLFLYTVLQIPVGAVLDRFGVTRIGRWGAMLWTIASGITAVATGYWGILAARVLLGVAEAPSFPAVSKATGHWFPRSERARATAIFDSSAKFSNVIGPPLIGFVIVRFGWRWAFAATSAISFVYFLAFYFLYREPSTDPLLTAEEHGHILGGGSVPEGRSESGAIGMLGYLLCQPKIWGLAIGFGAYDYSFYLFLTWLPQYLERTHGMGILKSSWYVAIPWSVATVTDLVVGGWLIDALIARGADETRVRKTVLIIGMLLGIAVVGATRTNDPAWAIFWISVSLAGLAASAPVQWSLPSLIGPKGGVGAAAGIMNFAGNVMGIIAPIATGFVVQETHSFTGAFIAAAAILVAGVLAFAFLLGRMETLPGPAPRDLARSTD